MLKLVVVSEVLAYYYREKRLAYYDVHRKVPGLLSWIDNGVEHEGTEKRIGTDVEAARGQ